MIGLWICRTVWLKVCPWPRPCSSASSMGGGSTSFAGSGGRGSEVVSCRRHMTESAGNSLCFDTAHRASGSEPVDEKRETSGGWTL